MAKQRFLPESCFMLLILFPLSNFCVCCPQYQKEALVQFKFVLLGNNSSVRDPHGLLDSWNSSTSDCCEWEHVFCISDTNPQQVSDLDFNYLLPQLSIDAVVTFDVLVPLLHLQTLESLRFSHNMIEGTIDRNLSSLRILTWLDLSYNSLQGSIPPEIGNFTKLEYLDLSYNFLSMEIPASIGNLVSLSVLDLSNNNLEGEIPATIQQLHLMDTLILGYNFLSGEIPPWLFDLENLTMLDIGGNKLLWKSTTTTFPKSNFSYNHQTQLSYLDLSANNLKGSFPQWLLGLNLDTLHLSDNMLTGLLPPRLFLSQKLSTLSLARNNFTGRLPDTIGLAIGLETLVLSDNQFSGAIPLSISNLSSLTLLNLSGNALSGNQFPNFSRNLILQWFDVSSNRFSCQLPFEFPQTITVLELHQNDFAGVLPHSLSNLSSLIYLDLHSNSITGNIPQFLSQLSSLQFLNLRDNSLRGPIPENLSNLTSLQILDFSGNYIGGKIPSSLGQLNGMTSNFSGPIPPFNIFTPNSRPRYVDYPPLEVFWKNLKQNLHNLGLSILLDLSNNQLSGEIPDSLGGLETLKLLNLSRNKLSGKIPMTFGDLKSLESLDLSHNNLSGKMPQTLGKLLELTDLDVSNNGLTGRIPDGPQMDRMNSLISYANNSGLCGLQIQLPCEKASPNKPPKKVAESESSDVWFSWMMAGIAYPFAFLTTVLVFYLTGYFNV